MTEEQQPEISLEDLQKSVAEKDSMIEDFSKQLEAVKAKNTELLTEAKKAKARVQEELEAKAEAEKEKALKDGEFEQLYKSSEEKRLSLQEQLENLHSNINKEKIKSEAMRIASKLADGHNINILAPFIEQDLSFKDGEMRVLNRGELSTDTLDDLTSRYQNNPMFQDVIRGNKSKGGGASGGGKVSDSGTISREDFNKLSQTEKASFFKSGGTLTN